MAIDLEKIKQRKAALENKVGGSNSNQFWRPQDGDQSIRIVATSDGDPFKDYFFHYNLGKNPGFLCPKKNYGEQCPVCEYASSLYNGGSEDEQKAAKTLFARQRFFSPVLVRGEEAEGIRVWGYGKMAYESLINLVLNPEYGDITDPEEGTDLLLSYGKPAGAQFPQTKLQPRRRSSPLCQDGPEKCAELMESIPKFDELFEKKTVQQVSELLDNYLSGADEEEGQEVAHYKKADETSSVDEAFNELLG